jgi:hypothetical protein
MGTDSKANCLLETAVSSLLVFAVSGKRQAFLGNPQGESALLRLAELAEVLIARTEPVTTVVTVIVGALQAQPSQHSLHLLSPAARIARSLSASAIQLRAALIGEIGVETRLDGPRRQSQGSLAKRHFQSLKIQLRHPFWP